MVTINTSILSLHDALPIYCLNATASALTATAATGGTLNWYSAATGGTPSATAPTPSTATAGTTSYYVSQTITTNRVAYHSPHAEILLQVKPAVPAATVAPV